VTFPVLIHLGPWRLPPHPVFQALAWCVAVALVMGRASRNADPLPRHQRVRVLAGGLIGGVLGARLLDWSGGQTIVGGLMGGLAATELVKGYLGIAVRTGDVLVFPACAGIAIGRIGCFLSGLGDGTYGVATSLPWGIDFGDGIRRHPTQLYEMLFLGLLASALWLARRRLAAPGQRFQAFMLAYMSWRVLVDFLKPDPRVLLGLSAIQLGALATLVYYALGAPVPRPRAALEPLDKSGAA